METEAGSPRALMRVIGLFEAIARSGQGLSLVELSQTLESPKSSLLTLLRPLVANGHLLHGGGRYRLGPAAFRLGATILAARHFPDQIREAMEWLAEQSRETVILAALDREAGLVSYVEMVESPEPVRYRPTQGSTRPLYISAAGRVLLAHQDAAWREAYLAQAELRAVTEHTITDPARLRAVIEAARRDGVSATTEEMIRGSAGCAAPVFGPDGTAAHAILIGAPVERFLADAERLKRLVKECGQRASAGAPPRH